MPDHSDHPTLPRQRALRIDRADHIDDGDYLHPMEVPSKLKYSPHFSPHINIIVFSCAFKRLKWLKRGAQ